MLKDNDAFVSLQHNVDNAVENYPFVKRVYLFGSRARGDNNAESDYDFRVEIDRSHKFGMFEYVDLFDSLSCICKTPINLVTTDDLGTSYFAKNIKEDEVLLYERTSDRITTSL